MIIAAETMRDDQTWARLIIACDGNPLHWGAVTAADYGEPSALRLTFSEKEETVGCALAYAQTRRRWRFISAGRDLELPTPPATAGAWRGREGTRRIYQALLGLARERGFDRLIIHPRFGYPLEDLPGLAPFRTDSVIEFSVDLQRDWEAIQSEMHRNHRKNIRRAEREGLTVVTDNTMAGLLHLRELQVTSSRRSAERGGGFGIRDKSYFEKVYDRVYSRGLGEVLLAKSGTDVLAGLAFVATANKGMTVRSGSSQAGYERNAMYLLQDAVLKIGHARGLREMNLGGVPAAAIEQGHGQHGLYEFKRGFGGAERLLHKLEVPLKDGSLPDIRAES